MGKIPLSSRAWKRAWRSGKPAFSRALGENFFKRGYNEKHRAERKAKSLSRGMSALRETLENINAFLEKYGNTEVQLIEADYKVLLDEAARPYVILAQYLITGRATLVIKSQKIFAQTPIFLLRMSLWIVEG